VLHVKKLDFGTAALAAPPETYLQGVLTTLKAATIFSPDVPWAWRLLLGQRTTYTKNAFFNRDWRRGGHTYMTSKQKNRFVRVNPEDMNTTALRVSLRSQRGTLESDRLLVWECILFVSEWWWTAVKDSTSLQSFLTAKSLRTVPDFTFQVSGGPVFHVLVVICFAHACAVGGLGAAEVAFETFGTKGLVQAELEAPGSTVTDAVVDDVYHTLSGALLWSAPFHLFRLRGLFVDPIGHNLPAAVSWSAEATLTWGVGCTVRTTDTTPNAATSRVNLLPVVSCVACPWTPEASNSAFEYFRAKKKKQGDKFFSYIPLENSRYVNYQIYNNVAPVALQPTTVTSSKRRGPKAETLQSQVRPGVREGPPFRSSQHLRYQQYNVSARLAVGQSGLQRSMLEHLGTIPGVEDARTHAVKLNLQACDDRVQQFVDLVTNHFSDVREFGGGVARLEIAVPHSDCARDPHDSLRCAIHDTIAIAQQHTYSYDSRIWEDLVCFYVSGLRSRIRCVIDAMQPVHATGPPTAEIERRDEAMEVVAEVFGAIKSFYNGRGTLEDKSRTLARTAYANQRPILCKLRDHIDRARAPVLTSNNVDWLSVFYNALGLSRDAVRRIPDFISEQKDVRPHVTVEGRACPSCFAIFDENDSLAFSRHICKAETPPHDWVRLSSATFKEHHREALQRLSSSQHLLIMLLSDRYPSVDIYLAGLGGTGKSTAVRVAMEHLCMEFGLLAYVALAPTNAAAMQIGGQTLSSFVGCQTDDLWDTGPNNSNWDRILGRFLLAHPDRAAVLHSSLRFVFLDEVGMLPASVVDFLDYFLRRVKGNLRVKFGGVKVVLIGDPLQVPPVQLACGKGFFFQSVAFCGAPEQSQGPTAAMPKRFVVLYLRKIQRTAVGQFVRMQIVSRLGGDFLEASDIEYAASWGSEVGDDCFHWTAGVRTALLHTIASSAERRSKMELKKRLYYRFSDRCSPATGLPPTTCDAPAYTICLEREEIRQLDAAYIDTFPVELRTCCKASDVWPLNVPQSATARALFQLPAQVIIAPGMRVCFLWNQVASSVGRNALGVVKAVDGKFVDVWVSLPNSASRGIVRVGAVKESVDFVHNSRKYTATRTQLPLQCCAAGTHYTVQGQTLAQVPCIFDNSRLTHEHYGAAYTVVSRFVDPAFIRPCHPLLPGDFIAHEDAVRFDQYHFQQMHSPLTLVDYQYTVTEGRAPAVGEPMRFVISPQCRANASANCACLLCCPFAEVVARTKAALAKYMNGQDADDMCEDALAHIAFDNTILDDVGGEDHNGETDYGNCDGNGVDNGWNADGMDWSMLGDDYWYPSKASTLTGSLVQVQTARLTIPATTTVVRAMETPAPAAALATTAPAALYASGQNLWCVRFGALEHCNPYHL
jgi:hypothetical protein